MYLCIEWNMSFDIAIYEIGSENVILITILLMTASSYIDTVLKSISRSCLLSKPLENAHTILATFVLSKIPSC